MAFQWNITSQWEDRLLALQSTGPTHIRDWLEEYILEYYGVEELSELTEQQINEVRDFKDNQYTDVDPLQEAFSDLISSWESL